MKPLNTILIVFACALASVGWLCFPYLMKKAQNHCDFKTITERMITPLAGKTMFYYVLDDEKGVWSEKPFNIGDLVCIKQ